MDESATMDRQQERFLEQWEESRRDAIRSAERSLDYYTAKLATLKAMGTEDYISYATHDPFAIESETEPEAGIEDQS